MLLLIKFCHQTEKTTVARSITRSAKYDKDPNMRFKQQLYELNPLMGRSDSDINISSEDKEMNWENGEYVDNESQPFSRHCSLDLLSETLSELRNKDNGLSSKLRLILLGFMRTEDRRGVPSQCTVIKCNKDTGKMLLEYAHGGQKLVILNLVQKTLFSIDDHN